MLSGPIINSNVYGHSSLEIMIADISLPLNSVKEISYSGKLEPGKAYGTGVKKLARTVGQYDCTGSMTVLRTEADQIRASLQSISNIGYMAQPFNLSITYAENGQPTVTDVLVGVRITSDDTSSSSGSEPIEVKFELDIMDLQLGVQLSIEAVIRING
jgi:hypothetical protein